MAALKRTVSDNPAQVRLLDEMDQTINDWQDIVATPTIELRREIGHAKTMDDMADLVGEAKGKVYFDKFRDHIKTFKGREAALMASRQEETRKTASNTRNILLFGTITTLLLALVISFIIGRAIVNPINRIIEGLGEGANQAFTEVAENSSKVGELIGEISEASREQSTGIEQVNTAVNEMDKVTQQNAANAEQSASASEEMNAQAG